MKSNPPMTVAAIFLLSFSSEVSFGQSPQPRIFLQAASHGNVWAARRDQAMEMARDFQKACPGVKITLLQSAADYTVLLNHIEVGLFARDNQFQVANKDGDMISLREKNGMKSGSIASGVKAACEVILSDWKTHATVSPAPPVPSVSPPAPVPPVSQLSDSAEQPTAKADSEAVPSQVPAKASVPTPARSVNAVINQSSPSPLQAGDESASLGITVGASEQNGVLIVRITEDSAAYLSGMHVGDVINFIDGKRIRSEADFVAAMSGRKAGSTVRVNYMFHSGLGWMQGSEKVLTLQSGNDQ
ncbi:MAG: PDZ domain-containing protein [Candidatus Sulfotelmatobacter sp.]